MKINSLVPSNGVNKYNDNKIKTSKNSEVVKSDSLQISSEGRSLSNLAIGNTTVGISDPKRVEAIKNEIEKGTYKPNPTLIAQKMLDVLKGREA